MDVALHIYRIWHAVDFSMHIRFNGSGFRAIGFKYWVSVEHWRRMSQCCTCLPKMGCDITLLSAVPNQVQLYRDSVHYVRDKDVGHVWYETHMCTANTGIFNMLYFWAQEVTWSSSVNFY